MAIAYCALVTTVVDGEKSAPKHVELPFKWDASDAPRAGQVTFELILRTSLPILEEYAIYIPRIGNQFVLELDDEVVAQSGRLGESSWDSAKAPTIVYIKPKDLNGRTGETRLKITITTQSGRWGGMSRLYFERTPLIWPLFRRHEILRQDASRVIVISLGLMGLMAGGLWWRQRDPSYGLLALTAIFGVVRMGDRLLPHPPLPWPEWGIVTSIAFVIHLMLMARFAMLNAGVESRWVRPAFWTCVIGCSAAAAVSLKLGYPKIWTAALYALIVPGAAVLWAVSRQAIRTRDRNSTALCIAGFIVIIAGVRDLLFVRDNTLGYGSFSLLPHAVFIFVLLMGWIVVERYSQMVRQYKDLNATLEDRIALRERELREIHAQMEHQASERAALDERQRIMRDIHDGVGAHLVSLLSLVRREDTDREHLHEQISGALDELRVAVDSLQPVHGDLVTVLATLRYRLDPRMRAAGLEVIWNVDALPQMDGLHPQMVLQIQRLLLEAFTNVLRHSNASQIEVSAKALQGPDRMVLAVADDGVGFDGDTERAHGVGIKSMRTRATAIGAQLRVQSAVGKGTRIELEIPANAGRTPSQQSMAPG